MRKFGMRLKAGTKVKVQGYDNWLEIEWVHETRNWVKIVGYEGLWQRNHITKYSNK
jgi:hypothetical protein